jgi:hypothetical protein
VSDRIILSLGKQALVPNHSRAGDWLISPTTNVDAWDGIRPSFVLYPEHLDPNPPLAHGCERLRSPAPLTENDPLWPSTPGNLLKSSFGGLARQALPEYNRDPGSLFGNSCQFICKMPFRAVRFPEKPRHRSKPLSHAPATLYKDAPHRDADFEHQFRRPLEIGLTTAHSERLCPPGGFHITNDVAPLKPFNSSSTY